MSDSLWMQVINAEITTLEAQLGYVRAMLAENSMRLRYLDSRRQRVKEIAPHRLDEVDEIITHLEEMHDALNADRQSILTQLERGPEQDLEEEPGAS